jgi:hypothetical protein
VLIVAVIALEDFKLHIHFTRVIARSFHLVSMFTSLQVEQNSIALDGCVLDSNEPKFDCDIPFDSRSSPRCTKIAPMRAAPPQLSK